MIKQGTGLDENKKSNNFDVLRLLFAIFVIITHSYTLAGNYESEEPLYKFTDGQLNFSYIGLRGFFIISGFLIYQSFERSPSSLNFIWKRFLRIFPGLFTINIITVLVIGPVFTHSSVSAYLLNKNTFSVFLESMDLFFSKNSHCLPGTFESNNFGCEVNGSLWTISYEFFFYICFLPLFFTLSRRYIGLFLFAFISILVLLKVKYVIPYFKYEYYVLGSEIGLKALTDFGLFFLLGSLFAFFKYNTLHFRAHLIIVMISSIFILVLLLLKSFQGFYCLLLVPFILSIALQQTKSRLITASMGDVSYGIYLSGFLIQQMLLSFRQFLPLYLVFFTVPVSFIYGYFSWKMVEKPALKMKYLFVKNEING